jgi:hypothetical protein
MNKKSILFILMLLPALAIGLTACGDDDPVQGDAKNIEGTYVGEITGASADAIPDLSITVTAKGEVQVDVKLDSFDVGTTSIPSISATCDVSYKTGTYNLSGKTTVALDALGGPLDVGLTGTVIGKIITLKIEVLTMTPIFVGNKK